MMQLLRAINPLSLKGSWKTTLCGIVAVVAAVAQEVEVFPGYEKELQFLFGVSVGVGVLLARDADKRSEDHGLPPPTP